ncbi:MAG: DegT/DnrJ/EryC1/StrS family aminotransferase [Pirellulales bacterium]|nr:DegT/DnrJ/EryC1/StrS family aminotransferase [Pirellulales bacterium]
MPKKNVTRRHFLAASTVPVAAALTSTPTTAYGAAGKDSGKLAVLGGKPVRKIDLSCKWPLWGKKDEEMTLAALRSGTWSRSKIVREFEKKFAKMMGAKRCIGTNCGTHSLFTALAALDIGGGDEVITTPYTFVATIQAILLHDALPVFVDTDPDTFMINPDKIEEKITENTRAILPVHLEGEVCHMDKIKAIAKKHNLKVVEDACQGHMAEWKGKNTGTLGDLGCFSFQNSKDITCGEGGAILGDDDELMDRCFSIHNFGRAHGSVKGWGLPVLGYKARMAEYQASILIPALDRVEAQHKKMTDNHKYLVSKLEQIPGIVPRKSYPETTAIGFYTFSFRYKKEHFNGASRSQFLKALRAEGVGFHAGGGPGDQHNHAINKSDSYLEKTLTGKTFSKIYSKERLDSYRRMCDCPDNDQLFTEYVGCGGKQIFLNTKKDMDDIYNAVLKVYENRDQLAKV